MLIPRFDLARLRGQKPLTLAGFAFLLGMPWLAILCQENILLFSNYNMFSRLGSRFEGNQYKFHILVWGQGAEERPFAYERCLPFPALTSRKLDRIVDHEWNCRAEGGCAAPIVERVLRYTKSNTACNPGKGWELRLYETRWAIQAPGAARPSLESRTLLASRKQDP